MVSCSASHIQSDPVTGDLGLIDITTRDTPFLHGCQF